MKPSLSPACAPISALLRQKCPESQRENRNTVLQDAQVVLIYFNGSLNNALCASWKHKAISGIWKMITKKWGCFCKPSSSHILSHVWNEGHPLDPIFMPALGILENRSQLWVQFAREKAKETWDLMVRFLGYDGSTGQSMQPRPSPSLSPRVQVSSWGYL